MVSEAIPQEGEGSILEAEWDDPLGIVDAVRKGWTPSFAEPVPPSSKARTAPEPSEAAPEQPRQQPVSQAPAPAEPSEEGDTDDTPDGQLPPHLQAKLAENWDKYRAIAEAGLQPGKKTRWTELPAFARDPVAASLGPEATESLRKELGLRHIGPIVQAVSQQTEQTVRAEERQLAQQEFQRRAEEARYYKELTDYFGDVEDFDAGDTDFASKAREYPQQAQDYLRLIQAAQPQEQVQQYASASAANALEAVWAGLYNHPYIAPYDNVRRNFAPTAATYQRYAAGPQGMADGLVDFMWNMAQAWAQQVVAQQQATSAPQRQAMIDRQVAAASRASQPKPDRISDQGSAGGFNVPLELLQDPKKFAVWVSNNKEEFEAWEREQRPGLELTPSR